MIDINEVYAQEIAEQTDDKENKDKKVIVNKMDDADIKKKIEEELLISQLIIIKNLSGLKKGVKGRALAHMNMDDYKEFSYIDNDEHRREYLDTFVSIYKKYFGGINTSC